MRTTLDIPEALLAEAQRMLGVKSKSETVALALRALIRRRKFDGLKDLLWHVRLDVDVAESRRRGRPSQATCTSPGRRER